MKGVSMKKRKLTEKQKEQRRELLAKARENKAPPKYVTVAPSVRELPDDHKLSLKNVRGWIKTNKDERNRLRKILRRSFDNSVNKRFQIVDTYVQNMEAYIRNGVWLDLFYGENQENKIGFRCKVMAYDKDGNPKRTEGVWYDDLGCIYKESEWA